MYCGRQKELLLTATKVNFCLQTCRTQCQAGRICGLFFPRAPQRLWSGALLCEMDTNKKSTLSNTLKLSIQAPIQLGELFLKAGFITQAQLDEATRASQYVPARLGQMMVMMGQVTHGELQDALQLQCLLREKIVDKQIGVKALWLTRHRRMRLRAAIESLQNENEGIVEPTLRLGDLLIEAGIITNEQLQEALSCNQSSGLPLGRVLVLSGAVTDETLLAGLNAQALIRQGTIDRLDAIKAIISCHKKKAPNAVSPDETLQLPARESLLEDLLVHAGIVTADEFELATITARDERIGVPRALLQMNLVDGPTIDLAIEMLQLIKDKFVSKAWCIQSLKDTTEAKEVKGDAVQEFAPPVKERNEETTKNGSAPEPPAKPFSLQEFLVLCAKEPNATEEHEYAHSLAEACYQLVDAKQLSLDEGVFAYDFCNRQIKERNVRMLEAAEVLGFHCGMWALYDALNVIL
jgi:hypothetical protein